MPGTPPGPSTPGGRRTGALGRLLERALRALRHADGSPLVRLYGPAVEGGARGRGATVTFNVLDAAG